MGAKGIAIGIWQKARRIFLILFVAQLVYIVILRWIDPPITITQAVSWFSGDGLKRDYVGRDEMSPNARLAVMSSEDQLFAVHNGFDWKSIEKALDYNNTKRKKTRPVRGASTISQQVAKNVFLWQGRSYFRKGLEVYFTFMIEKLWGKDRILEMYLNVAEMGTGIYGIEAASRAYFGKAAKKLTVNEAAMIAACLPNPKKYKVKPISRYVSIRYPWVVQQMGFLRDDPDVKNIVNPSRPNEKK